MKTNCYKEIKQFFTILIVLMPLLSVYSFPGIASLTLGEPFLIVSSIILLIGIVYSNSDKNLLLISPIYWLFIAYVLMISLIDTLLIADYSIMDTINSCLRLVFYTLVIFLLSKEGLDLALLKKLYLWVCLISAIYLIVQFLFGSIFHSYLPSTFSNLKIMYSDLNGKEYNYFLYDSYERLLFRPSSLFKEPSHFSRYIIYSLPIIALSEKQKSRFEITVFVSVLIAILMTRSAMGFLGVGVFMLSWLYFNRKTNNLYMTIGILLVSLGLLAASIYYGLAEQAVGRLSVETGSAGARVYRGFIIFSKMPLVFQIFGSGIGNYSAFSSHFNITTIYDQIGNSGDNYMNLIATTLVTSGIIGFVLYLFALVKLIWKKSAIQITSFIIFVFFAFGTNLYYYSAEYLLPMIFMTYNFNSVFDLDKQSNASSIVKF